MINKSAGKWLPDELQSAINTFIEQFNLNGKKNGLFPLKNDTYPLTFFLNIISYYGRIRPRPYTT